MNTIDAAIQIPAPPRAVWDYISDITNNTRWQIDCRSVTFLTSKKEGPGTRWRTTSEKGNDQVVEITAWYEGLGYQYTFIDGAPFRESVARIRLQEIPEGTVVQWTLTYEAGGVLGGVRASLGKTNNIRKQMVAGLRKLREVMASVAPFEVREAKSLMRDAPDVDARASYRPRHQPVVDIRSENAESSRDARPALKPSDMGPVIPEPPIADEDTRPRPAVGATPSRRRLGEIVEDAQEPDFLADLQDMSRFAPPPNPVTDTQPMRTVGPDGLPAQEPAAEGEFTFDDVEAKTETGVESAPSEDTIRALDELFAPELLEKLEADAAPEAPIVDAEQPAIPPMDTLKLDRDAADAAEKEVTAALQRMNEAMSSAEITNMDTSTMSIWDVFGVPRPSETREMPKVIESETTESPKSTEAVPTQPSMPPVPAVPSAALEVGPDDVEVHGVYATLAYVDISVPRRRGMRAEMRRRRVKLRRPNGNGRN